MAKQRALDSIGLDVGKINFNFLTEGCMPATFLWNILPFTSRSIFLTRPSSLPVPFFPRAGLSYRLWLSYEMGFVA